MFDDERRSATVEAIDDARGARRSSARTCARLMTRHPEIAVKLVIALGRRLRAANERLARQSFQTVQSRVAAVLGQLVEQARAEGAGERDVLGHRHAGRPGASSPAPRASRPAASSPCSSAPA